MTTQTEALKLALEALDQLTNVADTFSVSGVYLNEEVWAKKCLSDAYFAITTIEEALAVDKESLTTEARHMPSNDALYKAWNLIGADLAGLKFEDFVRHLLAQQSNEQVEPVAWIHEDQNMGYRALEWKRDALGYRGVWKKTPLYTHPPVPTAQTDRK